MNFLFFSSGQSFNTLSFDPVCLFLQCNALSVIIYQTPFLDSLYSRVDRSDNLPEVQRLVRKRGV